MLSKSNLPDFKSFTEATGGAGLFRDPKRRKMSALKTSFTMSSLTWEEMLNIAKLLRQIL